jgi:hypothetical protein
MPPSGPAVRRRVIPGCCNAIQLLRCAIRLTHDRLFYGNSIDLFPGLSILFVGTAGPCLWPRWLLRLKCVTMGSYGSQARCQVLT